MVRTQVQFPEALYADLKRLADDQEWTMAEAVRRGVELLLRSYPQTRDPAWTLPEARALGPFLAEPAAWREAASER